MAIEMPSLAAALPTVAGGLSASTPDAAQGQKTAELIAQAKAEQAGLNLEHQAPKNTPWEVPTLPKGFSLDQALTGAYSKATSYINKLVSEQGYTVSFAWRDGNAPRGYMLDGKTNQVVKEYDARQMLKIYADGPGGRGFIIDGKI